MDRRSWLEVACAAVLGVSWLPVPAQPESTARSRLRSLAVLDFEPVDDQNNPLTKSAQEIRLRNI